MTKKKIKNGKTIITHILLMIFAFIQIYPLFWLFEFSLKDNSEIFGGNIAGLPQHWRFGNYVTAFFQANIMQYFFNSVLVTVVTIILTVIIAAMSSYAISRMIWKGRELTLKLVLMGMMVPIHAAMLPLFIILSKAHMLNSYVSLIIPYIAFGLPMAIYLFISFMESLPREMEEAAAIDGCDIIILLIWRNLLSRKWRSTASISHYQIFKIFSSIVRRAAISLLFRTIDGKRLLRSLNMSPIVELRSR